VTGPSIPDGTLTFTSTEAQSQFGRVFDTAVGDQVVVITRHNAPRAVLMSIDRYNALLGAGAAALDSLASEFDALLDRLQAPAARSGLQQAFDAPPHELARAAIAEADPQSRAR
jgi:prevent-host-death family protein